MEQPPISVGDSKYKVGDVVTVTPTAGPPVTGKVTFVQAVKDTTRPGQWTYRYVVKDERGGVRAAPERIVSAAQMNGGKRKSRRRKGKSRRTRRSFSR